MSSSIARPPRDRIGRTVDRDARVRAHALRVAPILLSGLLTAGCGETPPPEAPPPQEAFAAATATVALVEVPRTVEAVGTVEPRVQVSPGTKIMGRIERVTVSEGDRVRRGQLLARLEQRDLAAAVEQARAAVALAEAQLDNARSQDERMRALHARGSVTDKNLEDATAAFRVGEARLAESRAALAAAEVTLGYAEIVSPLDGVVTDKRVEAGDMAAPGASLFTIEDTSRVKVAARFPESDVVGLQAGDPVRVRVDVLGQEWESTVDRVLPAGDPASRTHRIELWLDNPDGRLLSGMYAQVFVPRGSRETLTVPQAAVVSRGPLQGVFVVDSEARARLRWVRFGPVVGEDVEVISGLAPGERIVPSPPAGLVDGARIEER